MFKIVIAGWNQCLDFAMAIVVADHLKERLPDFNYETIGKPLLDWKKFLAETNIKYKWGHQCSPIIWKELEYNTGEALYIGNTSSFFEYCYCYYNFDVYLTKQTFPNLLENNQQLMRNIEKKNEEFKENFKPCDDLVSSDIEEPESDKNKEYTIIISGVFNNLMETLAEVLTTLAERLKIPFNIFLYSEEYFNEFNICYCDESGLANVKQIYKINKKLTEADLLIILNHIPYKNEYGSSLQQWFTDNGAIMKHLSQFINISQNKKLKILFPNLGPCCFNATMLASLLNFIPKENIAVATTDLSTDILKALSENTHVEIEDMFSSPVWGFVGVNHLIDVKNTHHKFFKFNPYERYAKVMKSTLKIGMIEPQIRRMEYLVYGKEDFWPDIVEEQKKRGIDEISLSKAIALVNIIENWIFEKNSLKVMSVGIYCNGTFGLDLKGFFSQPCRVDSDGNWIPSEDFPTPRDAFVSIEHLCEVAKIILKKQECTCDGLPDEDYPRTYCFCNKTIKPVCLCVPEDMKNRNMFKGCFCGMAYSSPDFEQEFCFCGWSPVCNCGVGTECECWDVGKEKCDCDCECNLPVENDIIGCLCFGKQKTVCDCERLTEPCKCIRKVKHRTSTE